MVRAGCLGAVFGGPVGAFGGYFGYLLLVNNPRGCMAGLEVLFRIIPTMFVGGLIGMFLGALAANLIANYLAQSRARRLAEEIDEDDYSAYC